MKMIIMARTALLMRMGTTTPQTVRIMMAVLATRTLGIIRMGNVILIKNEGDG